jgi:protein O-mannosyl-transferase
MVRARIIGMNKSTTAAYVALFFIVIATIAVYWQTLNHEFVNYDDPAYVVNNIHVNTGLTAENIRWSFTAIALGNWQPVTLLSHMADCELFGLNPRGHHLTSVLIHVVNAILLFCIIMKLTSSPWRSLFIALLFALHPLRVESVAWISERKDVLSGMFFMTTLLGYVHYVRRPAISTYLLTIASFTVGLMCKPMIVTLPFVLLLLDYWPLGRLVTGKAAPSSAQNDVAVSPCGSPLPVSRLLVEKLPFFVLSGILCFVSVYAQKADKALQSTLDFTLPQRMTNALMAYVSYLGKTFWPADLAVLYPIPQNVPALFPVMAFLVLAAATILFVRMSRQRPYILMGWLWFIGTLVPVIGLVQVGLQSMADRYTYLPSIGIYILVVWFLAETASKWRYHRSAFAILGLGLTIVLSLITSNQLTYWKNSIELFTHAIRVTHGNYIALINLGNALEKVGRYHDAIFFFGKALEIKPENAFAYYNMANALDAAGRGKEAIQYYKKSLQLDSGNSRAHCNLGVALISIGNIDEAKDHFKEAIRLDPNFADAHYNLGLALESEGRIGEAIVEYNEASRADPSDPGIRNSLENALLRQSAK